MSKRKTCYQRSVREENRHPENNSPAYMPSGTPDAKDLNRRQERLLYPVGRTAFRRASAMQA